jgi:hypothetical protein
MSNAAPSDAKLTHCRDCGHEVSTGALACPHCGAPFPYLDHWDGYGWEWKSRAALLGMPLVHISFKYRANRMPVVARGWLAVGQFSYGFVNISQFGFGPFAVSQFAVAGVALSQFCAAVVAVCQIGIVYDGWGQLVWRVADLL